MVLGSNPPRVAHALALFFGISPLVKLLAKLLLQSNGQIIIIIVIGGGGAWGGGPPPLYPPTAQAQASFTPPFLGVVRVAYPKLRDRMSNPL